MKKKSPFVAFILNLLFGGVGFWYVNYSKSLNRAGIVCFVGVLINFIENIVLYANEDAQMSNDSGGAFFGQFVIYVGLGIAGVALANMHNKSLSKSISENQTSKRCSNCAQLNLADASFCEYCGSKLS